MPVSGLLDAVTGMLARVAPGEVISIVHGQLLKIANDKSAGLLTLVVGETALLTYQKLRGRLIKVRG